MHCFVTPPTSLCGSTDSSRTVRQIDTIQGRLMNITEEDGAHTEECHCQEVVCFQY
jgi:hypothetical protein